MDGGRIPRSVLAGRMGVVRATQTAAAVGKVFAAVFAVLGVLSFSFILLLIAFFVYIGAEQEGRQVTMREVLGKLRVRDLMTPSPEPLDATATVADVATRMIRERKVAIPLVQAGRPPAVLSLQAVQEVPTDHRASVLARDVARPVAPLSREDDIWKAFQAMSEGETAEVPVVSGADVVGILSQSEVIRELQLRELDTPTQRPWGWRPRRQARV